MTYANFLLLFLVIPIIALVWLNVKAGFKRWGLLAVLSLIALLYTTLWDNYLVANRIWWYAPSQVSGILFGWVPVEEYLFFLLQPVMTGLWTFLVIRNFADRPTPKSRKHSLRWGTFAVLALLWLLSAGALIAGWPTARYLALILIWALVPLLLQVAYGADILWRRWRIVLLSLLPATIYLAAADIVAISSGIWTISSSFSLPILLAGILPLEELLFFFVTNCLIVFTVVLVSSESVSISLVRTGFSSRLRITRESEDSPSFSEDLV